MSFLIGTYLDPSSLLGDEGVEEEEVYFVTVNLGRFAKGGSGKNRKAP